MLLECLPQWLIYGWVTMFTVSTELPLCSRTVCNIAFYCLILQRMKCVLWIVYRNCSLWCTWGSQASSWCLRLCSLGYSTAQYLSEEWYSWLWQVHQIFFFRREFVTFQFSNVQASNIQPVSQDHDDWTVAQLDYRQLGILVCHIIVQSIGEYHERYLKCCRL